MLKSSSKYSDHLMPRIATDFAPITNTTNANIAGKRIFLLVILFFLCNLNQAYSEVASAPIPTTMNATIDNATALSSVKVTAESREKLKKIVYDKDFSKAIEQKTWQAKHPDNGEKQSAWQGFIERLLKRHDSGNGSLSGSMLGAILKTLALLALLAAIVWIAKNAQVWLAWFGRAQRRLKNQPEPQISTHYRQAFAPIWQGLPEKSQLTAFVQVALAKGDWLLALSTLYRGTLREIVDIYDLPITHATTEQQNSWLLQKATQTRHAGLPVAEQESAYFLQLVKMWAQVAYGQLRPTAEQMPEFLQRLQQLVSTWERLYLHRTSPLEHRFLTPKTGDSHA